MLLVRFHSGNWSFRVGFRGFDWVFHDKVPWIHETKKKNKKEIKKIRLYGMEFQETQEQKLNN